MKNIHLLPTDKPSRLHLWTDENDSKLALCDLEFSHTRNTQHIYITSEEEIKEGDWFIRDGSIHKCFRVHKTDIEFLTSIDSVYCGSNTFWSKGFCKKIILTTDQDLIKDGVQDIDDTFLQWFVKNPSCEEVKVDSKLIVRQVKPLLQHQGTKPIVVPHKIEYKLIIPKEENYVDSLIGKKVIWGNKEYTIIDKHNDSDFIIVDDKNNSVIGLHWGNVYIPKDEQKQHLIDMMKSDEELGLYDEKIEDIELEEVRGSSHCQFSVVENKLAIIYRNQLKILQAIKMLSNGTK